jgi:linoleoyl-CoA desaturase
LKGKHLNTTQDSELLRMIRRQVSKGLAMDEKRTKWILLGKFALYLSLLLVMYFGILTINNQFFFYVCFVCYGFSGLLLAFNFAHDLSHGTVFSKSLWNDLGFIFIYALNGAHAEAWQKRHVESHHFAPNVENYDTDLEISKLIRVIPNSTYYWFHRYQHVYAPVAYCAYSLYWVFIKDFVVYFKDFHSGKFTYHFSFWMQKIFYITYLLIFPLMFSVQSWPAVLIGFLLMHLLQSEFLLFTFFMTHHVEGLVYPSTAKDGIIKTSWIMNQIKSSNDMYPHSSLANFVFGGFNNHIAHHLFPRIHHIHYPDLNKILYDVLIQNGITPNQTTYWGGICSHLRHLKRMSVDIVH